MSERGSSSGESIVKSTDVRETGSGNGFQSHGLTYQPTGDPSDGKYRKKNDEPEDKLEDTEADPDDNAFIFVQMYGMLVGRALIQDGMDPGKARALSRDSMKAFLCVVHRLGSFGGGLQEEGEDYGDGEEGMGQGYDVVVFKDFIFEKLLDAGMSEEKAAALVDSCYAELEGGEEDEGGV
jgi:hypothetical protein